MLAAAATDAQLPAIAGGAPAKKTPYGSANRYGEEELAELKEALAQQTLFYAQGRKVRELEEAYARAAGARYAVACSSGTAAIHAALAAVGVGPGDEVITAPITDMGTVAPILLQGAVPLFADVDLATGSVDPACVEALISPRSRAILPVHLGGIACDLDALRDVARAHSVPLIEDCAQAAGCEYCGKAVGSFGDIGCFSLNEFKQISCGDGGIAVTNHEQLAGRLRMATDKGYDRRPGADTRAVSLLATNYRMTELQGAVALAQLRKLPSIVERRRRWCGLLTDLLAGAPGLILPDPTPGSEPSWWFYLAQVDEAEMGVGVDEFVRAAAAEGIRIGARYIGQPIYAAPIFREHTALGGAEHAYRRADYPPGLCPNAERLLGRCATITVNEAYTDTDAQEVAAGLRKVAAWFRGNPAAAPL